MLVPDHKWCPVQTQNLIQESTDKPHPHHHPEPSGLNENTWKDIMHEAQGGAKIVDIHGKDELNVAKKVEPQTLVFEPIHIQENGSKR